jgi:hypothetical protein
VRREERALEGDVQATACINIHPRSVELRVDQDAEASQHVAPSAGIDVSGRTVSHVGPGTGETFAERRYVLDREVAMRGDLALACAGRFGRSDRRQTAANPSIMISRQVT